MPLALKWGVILGLASVAISAVQNALGSNPLESNWVNSVISIAITVTIIILAQREYKQNGDGFMSYGKGFVLGFLTSAIATVLGLLFMYVFFTFVSPETMEEIWRKAEDQMIEQGQSDEAIEMGLGIGKKLFWVFAALGGLFSAALIPAIITIFTQKKNPEAAY